MAKIVNTLRHGTARAKLPLLKRLWHMLAPFMRHSAHTERPKHKGFLALLRLLHQYSMGAERAPLGMGGQRPFFSVPLPVLGAMPFEFAPVTESMHSLVARAHADIVASKPKVLPPYRAGRRNPDLHGIASVAYRTVLGAGTAWPVAESGMQVALSKKPRWNKSGSGMDILAHRPFFVQPRLPSSRFLGRSGPVAQTRAVGAAPLRVSSVSHIRQILPGEKKPQLRLHVPEALQRHPVFFEHDRNIKHISTAKQPGNVALPARLRVAVPPLAVPVAQGEAEHFLPSSPLMRAAVQPVVPLGQPAPAIYAQGATRPVPPAPVAPHVRPMPRSMPSHAAMQGLGEGESMTLAALSTLGSI